MAFNKLFNQDFGVLFHIRCLTPMFYVATTEPDEFVSGLLTKLDPKKDRVKIVEDATFEDLPEHMPTRDEIVFVFIRNPGDWFGDPDIVEHLSTNNDQLRLNNRHLQRLIFIGPPDLTAPEALRPLMPRIEADFQLDSKRPKPEPVSESHVTAARESVREVLTNLVAVSKVEVSEDQIEMVTCALRHLSPPEIDNAMAQVAIRAKGMWAEEGMGFGSVAHKFIDEAGPFVEATLDEAHRLNGWPVYKDDQGS